MNYLYIRRFLFFIFIVLLIQMTCGAQSSHIPGSKNPEKGLYGKTGKKSRDVKIKGPKSVKKAIREQEKNQKRLKKEYAKSIEASRKRAYDIQSPEVQLRMTQNQKDTAQRDREKKKRVKAGMRKAGKKYK